jgi:hypothetical protein
MGKSFEEYRGRKQTSQLQIYALLRIIQIYLEIACCIQKSPKGSHTERVFYYTMEIVLRLRVSYSNSEIDIHKYKTR